MMIANGCSIEGEVAMYPDMLLHALSQPSLLPGSQRSVERRHRARRTPSTALPPREPASLPEFARAVARTLTGISAHVVGESVPPAAGRELGDIVLVDASATGGAMGGGIFAVIHAREAADQISG
jgi:hypothetical protein